MKLILPILFVFIFQLGYSQDNIYKSEVVKLAEIYKKYHVIEPNDSIYLKLDSIKHIDLKQAKTFITELIQKQNNIADDKFLNKPDSVTLHSLYLVRGLTWNMFNSQFSKTPMIAFGIDSLINEKVNYNEQFANYYSMLFTSILNKNRPLDMSKINFDLDNYNFENDIEKGIFFLESMETLGTLISGYFYVEPPNIKKAMTIISNYPTFNNEEYYKFTSFKFDDFDFTYSSKDPKGSYKKYLLNKYMNTVMSHAICLSENENTRPEMNDILSNSILINREYWKYSESPEVFEQIFGK